MGPGGNAQCPLPEGSRERAIYFAQQALAADKLGDFEGAFQLYQQALDYFGKEVKKTEKGKVCPGYQSRHEFR